MSFRAAPEAERRLEELVAKEHTGTITQREGDELESHLEFNHLIILLKARAAEKISQQQQA